MIKKEEEEDMVIGKGNQTNRAAVASNTLGGIKEIILPYWGYLLYKAQSLEFYES